MNRTLNNPKLLGYPLFNLALRYAFDWSYHPLIRASVSPVLLSLAYELKYHNFCRSFNLLCAAHRIVKKGFWAHRATAIINSWLSEWHRQCVKRMESRQVHEDRVRLLKVRSLVLKPPIVPSSDAIKEKGVLLVKGEMEPLICLCNVGRLLQDYWLVLEPGSAGYALPSILYFTAFPDFPVVVMAPAVEDRRFLSELHRNLVHTSIGASDWVNPDVFRPLPDTPKIYDAVMVAYWGRVKRHHVLFKAMRKLRDESYRVALVGFPWDEGTLSQVENLAKWYGVRRQVTFFEKLCPEEVNMVLNQSKVNVLLSLKEGANKTLFEGMFAGVPAILLENNIGVNKEHIVEGRTGRLIKERELPEVLLWFREHYREFRPREWAMQNISPQVSAAKLNTLLRELAHQRGEPWTRDIVAKTNCPEPRYYPDASVAEGFPTVDDILRQYGSNNKQ
jgi:glycosyltransferase involved in cell wall biosynthesis